MDNGVMVYTPPVHTNIGWIIIIVILTFIAIIFLILWIAAANQSGQSVCFGTFGVKPGIDGNAIIACGTNGTEICTFSMNTVADCVSQCNNLSSICNAFTFAPTTSTMKIVTRNGLDAFTSATSDLYERQIGQVS